MRRFVQEGRQVYVVCPMIEENAETDLESAVSTYNRLAQTAFPDLQLGLLHGSLKPAAKDQVMDAFMAGEIQILVSTTVIEVGVDNPNAALMVIENAERFGLAQLHQLRGRIGRGEPSLDLRPAERQRRRNWPANGCARFATAADGFAVAEKDLELRGPGDFFGTRQHGLPALRLANLYRDRELLQEVQDCLDKLFETDPGPGAARAPPDPDHPAQPATAGVRSRSASDAGRLRLTGGAMPRIISGSARGTRLAAPRGEPDPADRRQGQRSPVLHPHAQTAGQRFSRPVCRHRSDRPGGSFARRSAGRAG